MEELAKTAMADMSAQEPSRKINRGWFKRGSDPRINLQGRPLGQKADAGDTRPVAKRADRIMLLDVRERDLTWRLSNQRSPWIVNLPADFEIIGCQLDAGVAVLVIRSATFPRITRGAVIPSFNPSYNGLKWRRRCAPMRTNPPTSVPVE